ncbi:hypothetical protein LUZ63_009270 [Rhynchospora breviuscula]|uniref:Uncharacterized protein n=1 Tax=Rhynchospora breviuscula TaxID=2022672 RepID=A0A9Q0CF39_9POAL|nr:hypothetical protein LUZ63_009270 [Rhynchospora breviuscula]
MAPGFARSVSLPLSPSQKKASFHVRSVSLPCQSHPIISNLEEQIQTVQSWATNPERSSAWIVAGLVQIDLLHTALEDFLQLSQTQETLQQSASVDQVLDDMLQLVDFYGSFLSYIGTLKQCNSEMQSALRRQDGVQMASSLRSQLRVEKEMAQLASGFRRMTKCNHLSLSSDAKELEIVMEAICTTAFASMTVFMGVGALSAAASSTKMTSAMKSLKRLAINTSLKKRATDVESLERLEELEENIRDIEFSSERLLKSLINSRISLLNIRTSSW